MNETKRKFEIEIIPYGAEVLIMQSNKIYIAFVAETRITIYNNYELPAVKYFLTWQDEDGDELKAWYWRTNVFLTRDELVASL